MTAPARLERGDLLPAIVSAPPGPASRELSAVLAGAEAPGINTLGPRDAPAVVWAEAVGANVLDVDGNRYVDLTSGFGAAAIGHRHPRVVAAIAAQAGKLVHGLGDVAAHPARIELARRLAALAPVDEPRVHFAVSGADAVEIALKTALAATGRPGVLAFDPGYHGLSLGALAGTSRPAFRAPFAEHLTPHVRRARFAAPVEEVEALLATGSFGAILVEPVVGREGVLVAPPGWLVALARAARSHGALLVADEIFTGFGRTGRLFAVDRDGVRPDLVCCGKALGGGLPIGAVLGARRWMETWRTPGEALHTGTFVAHPLATAAALATLEVLDEERLVERAAALEPALAAGLGRLAARSGRIRAVRTIGALAALELERAEDASRLAHALAARGVLVLAGGASGSVVQLAPPFVVTDAQLAAAFDAFASALDELDRSGDA
ncbi:MAG: 4-aminobutyrate aminotransferase [Acidobacteriota bacterium]